MARRLRYATSFYGVVDLEESTLLYANAGHFPWPVLCDGKSVTVLEHPGVPIGMVPGTQYEQHRILLGAPVSLSVFSDGVLGVLPQSTLSSKLTFLRGFFGRLNVSIEEAMQDLHLAGARPLPDDVAILIIQRGTDDGSHARA